MTLKIHILRNRPGLVQYGWDLGSIRWVGKRFYIPWYFLIAFSPSFGSIHLYNVVMHH
jgi:hypothetical protein